MEIILEEVTIEDLVNSYENNGENGVVGLFGNLNIRPQYQREFIYAEAQRDTVIQTVQKGLPLPTMYWSLNEDDSFEVIDGQQQLMSICEYATNNFPINKLYFHELPQAQQDQILQYKLTAYVCRGTPTEKLDWFKTINSTEEKLTAQELRNAAYAGPWLASAKQCFSKADCPAFAKAQEYVSGTAIHQDYLETAIQWISRGTVEQYMAEHQFDTNATILWLHFQIVIEWVKQVFPNYRPEMKGVNWGPLYRSHGKEKFDTTLLETRVAELMQDASVTNKQGIYTYLLTGEKKHLSCTS